MDELSEVQKKILCAFFAYVRQEVDDTKCIKKLEEVVAEMDNAEEAEVNPA